MVKFLTDKEYDRFPEDMREAAREAYETFCTQETDSLRILS